MNRKIKIAALATGIAALFYGLQYGSTAIHYNCQIIKDDCVPPINLAGEFIYRLMVHPYWLNQFEIQPVTFQFKDGRYTFWEGEVENKKVVIRVGEGESPVMQWIGKGLPLGIPIRPADGEQISKWMADNPEYELNT